MVAVYTVLHIRLRQKDRGAKVFVNVMQALSAAVLPLNAALVSVAFSRQSQGLTKHAQLVQTNFSPLLLFNQYQCLSACAWNVTIS